MTEPTWPEKVMAGKLFAILTSGDAGILANLDTVESVEIDHGILRIAMKDGEKYELTVRQLK